MRSLLVGGIGALCSAVMAVPVLADELAANSGKSAIAKQSRQLPRTIDLRPQFIHYGLTPRSQGSRNTCSVFVTTWALEFALSKRLGRSTPLSVEYLNWACNQTINNTTADRGQFFHDLLRGFEKYGICLDADMPYRKRFDTNAMPSASLQRKAITYLAQPLTVHWINPWKKDAGLTNDQIHSIKEVLANGWPVAAGSSHSRLLVGYFDNPRQPGGGVFITKDSGAAAFDSVTYAFAKEHIGDVFWVEAPVKGSKKKAVQPAR